MTSIYISAISRSQSSPRKNQVTDTRNSILHLFQKRPRVDKKEHTLRPNMKLHLWLLFWFAVASTKRCDRGGGNDTKEQRTLQLPCQETTPQFVSGRSPRLRTSSRRNRRRRLHGKIKAGIKRLRAEMAEISEEQKCIKEGQRQVRKKYEEIEAERKQLWKETELIANQSAGIQSKLNLMFRLVKARAQNDTALAAELTHSLRDLVAKQSVQIR